jgi:hypothetical protein
MVLLKKHNLQRTSTEEGKEERKEHLSPKGKGD